MKVSKIRLFLLATFFILSFICWNYSFIYPIKVFVVYLHEISHALAALCTGGSVKGIFVSWSEVGATITQEGIFFITALSGYLGSIFWGSLMFYSALSGKYIRTISIIIGSLILLSTIFWVRNTSVVIYIFFFGWGTLFLLTPIISIPAARIVLFFLGGMSSLYSIYDLNDFFRGEILKTDAGIIATHYIHEPLIQKIVAYTIAIFISSLGIWIMTHLVYKALYIPSVIEDPSEEKSSIQSDKVNILSEKNSEEDTSQNENSELWEEFQDWKEFKKIKRV